MLFKQQWCVKPSFSNISTSICFYFSASGVLNLFISTSWTHSEFVQFYWFSSWSRGAYWRWSCLTGTAWTGSRSTSTGCTRDCPSALSSPLQRQVSHPFNFICFLDPCGIDLREVNIQLRWCALYKLNIKDLSRCWPYLGAVEAKPPHRYDRYKKRQQSWEFEIQKKFLIPKKLCSTLLDYSTVNEKFDQMWYLHLAKLKSSVFGGPQYSIWT